MRPFSSPPPRAPRPWGITHDISGTDHWMLFDGDPSGPCFMWSQAPDVYPPMLFADQASAEFFCARFLRASHPKAQPREWPHAN